MLLGLALEMPAAWRAAFLTWALPALDLRLTMQAEQRRDERPIINE